jgi:hypothetical protein
VNTGGATLGPTAEAVGNLADDASHGSARHSREEEELLAAIAAALQARAAQPLEPIQSWQAGGPAEAWRHSGGALTGTAAHIDGAEAPSMSSPGSETTESRLVARIETPGLGSVCVVVDRSESGMKVVLAMDDAAAVRNAQADQAALVHALEAVGITVASVSVTRIGDGGISFAQVRDAHEARMFGASDAGEAAEGKPEGRFRRRLNLVG